MDTNYYSSKMNNIELINYLDNNSILYNDFDKEVIHNLENINNIYQLDMNKCNMVIVLIIGFDTNIKNDIYNLEIQYRKNFNYTELKNIIIKHCKKFDYLMNQINKIKYINFSENGIYEYNVNNKNISIELKISGRKKLGSINDVCELFKEKNKTYDVLNKLKTCLKKCNGIDKKMFSSQHIICCENFNNIAIENIKSFFIPENCDDNFVSLYKNFFLEYIDNCLEHIKKRSITYSNFNKKTFIYETNKGNQTLFILTISIAHLICPLYTNSIKKTGNYELSDMIEFKINNNGTFHFYPTDNNNNKIKKNDSLFGDIDDNIQSNIYLDKNDIIQQHQLNHIVVNTLSKFYIIYDEELNPLKICCTIKFNDIVLKIKKFLKTKKINITDDIIKSSLKIVLRNLINGENVIRIRSR